MDEMVLQPVESGPPQKTRGYSRAPGSANVAKPACKRHAPFPWLWIFVLTRYYRELLNFLSRAVNDRHAAADLAQESYVRVLALQQSGQHVAEPRALLYRTARNLVIDRHRRGAVRGQALDTDDDGAADLFDTLAAPAASEPETAAMSAQAVEAMLAVIADLPLRCREAFILHKFDGLPQAEVARRMGISVTMVERHIKLAMQACRRCQDAQDGASPPSSP